VRIVDAVWEKRNLGVSTAEVAIGNNDSLESFRELSRELEKAYQYVCVKCSTVVPEFLFELQDLGYRFIETQFEIKFDRDNKAVLPSSEGLYSLYADRISFREMDDMRFDEVMGIIGEEGMFTTDRVYIDAAFPQHLAGRRYVGWCRDLKDSGSFFLEWLVNGKPVGFYEYTKTSATAWHTSLGGIYPQENAYAFLTPAINQKLLEYFCAQGMKTMRSAVSSNNSVMLRLHLSVGYQISAVHYVFVRHNNLEGLAGQ